MQRHFRQAMNLYFSFCMQKSIFNAWLWVVAIFNIQCKIDKEILFFVHIKVNNI